MHESFEITQLKHFEVFIKWYSYPGKSWDNLPVYVAKAEDWSQLDYVLRLF